MQFRNGSHRPLSLANSGISGNGTGVEKEGNTVDFLLTAKRESSCGTAVLHARRQEQPSSQDRQH
jgi:hypothetical protein